MVFLGLAANTLSAKEAISLTDDPVLEQRLITISEEMRCLVCQNESLAGSRSDLANDLRQEIRVQIKAGKSDAQIRDFMVERYGDFMLYRPPVKPITWFLWLGPFALLLAGMIALLTYLKRRNKEIIAAELTDDENHCIDLLLKENQHD
ncbi:cytochrome c-type biogenesis protein CcmH [Polynucleobacter meluiroseus]|uniref:Cytochrome c-type biogenesis protein n=2 Tax=Polynucleobacter meluiroseus TaxID=1938814 RepID=A0A240DYR9_9BURK|nr:cytochrome c-type biogenesis protein CcmH [Polynucleobacter meluiroseus]